MPCRTTARSAPTSGTVEDLRELDTRAARDGASALVLDLVLNHVAREHEWAVRARAGEAALPRLLPRVPRPRGARRLRADAAGGVPRLRPGQLHLGRGPPRLGVDDVQRVAVGRQLVEPRGAASSTPTSSSSSPTSAWRCCGSTPSRSSGSGSAPTARTSPRCTRSPRRCGRWPGSRVRRWFSRPRPSSGRATWSSTSVSAPTPARSATSPTTTASWCRCGRCWRRATSSWHGRRWPRLPPTPHHRHVGLLRPLPRRHRLGDRRRRRPRGRPGRLRAPPVPLRLVCRGVPRLVGTWAGVPAQPRHGDRRISGTAASLTGLAGGAGPRRAPGSPGCSWPTPSSRDGAAYRWCGAATSSACPTTRAGPRRRATRTTTDGRTAPAWTGP